MKHYRVILLLVAGIFLIASAYLFHLYHEEGAGREPVLIQVRPGDSFGDIKLKLKEKGLLEHPGIFRWAAYLTRKERRIRAGEYRFSGSESVSEILDKLTEGAVDYRRIVIPEGLMLAEIASIASRSTGIDSARFVSLSSDSSLIDSLGFRGETLEGYLFPDTYLVTYPFSGRGLIRQMARRFRDVYREEASAEADSAGMPITEVVTLASIIQAEAREAGEMSRISAVYHNRLDKGMKLEADPTVAYALGGIRRRLWYKDLEVDSPYNTYKYKGLPPGPICSPGRDAILAAIRPEPDFEAYYFVADGTGGHIFSRTLAEHNRAKKMIKKGELSRHGGMEE